MVDGAVVRGSDCIFGRAELFALAEIKDDSEAVGFRG